MTFATGSLSHPIFKAVRTEVIRDVFYGTRGIRNMKIEQLLKKLKSFV